jgi:hypothetical protein
MFELPENFVSSITTQMTGILAELSPYITFLLAVLVSLMIITFIISAIRG